MLGSAASGMLARIPCHPIDTCKTRIQIQTKSAAVDPNLYKNFVDAFSRIWLKEGFRGLYRGFGIAFLGSAPASCLYFTSYEWSRDSLTGPGRMFSQYPFIGHFMAGMLAETISCMFWVPIDVVKERMQIQRYTPGATNIYRNSFHALTTIVKTQGLPSIYKGYGATLASFGPFSALYFLFYEKLKTGARYVSGLPEEVSLPFVHFLLCGATAGALASLCTNPLDMAKLRLQVQRGVEASNAAGGAAQELPFAYKNIVHGVTQIVKTEGLPGLFRGAGARMAFHAPMTAISITLFEECKRAFDTLL